MLAEREGFEPSMPVTRHGGLANRCTRPLCDLSVARRRPSYHAAPARPAPSIWYLGRPSDDLEEPAVTDPSTPPPTRTKEEIEAFTVGEVGPLDGPIVLAEPDPSWPALYAREEARIRASLGDRVLRDRAHRLDVRAGPRRQADRRHHDDRRRRHRRGGLGPATWRPPATCSGSARTSPTGTTTASSRARTRTSTSTSSRTAASSGSGWSGSATGCGRTTTTGSGTRRRSASSLARDWEYVQNYADAKTAVVEEIMARAGLPGGRP